MTPVNAIDILDKVTADIPLTRAEQTNVILALQLLRKAVTPAQPLVDKDKSLA